MVAILGTLAVVAVVVTVGLWLDRKVSIVPRAEDLREAGKPKPRGQDHEVGLAPSTALHSDPEKMARVVERQRCCKTPMAAASEDEIRYDGRLLRAIKLRCAACGGTRSLYYEPRV